MKDHNNSSRSSDFDNATTHPGNRPQPEQVKLSAGDFVDVPPNREQCRQLLEEITGDFELIKAWNQMVGRFNSRNWVANLSDNDDVWSPNNILNLSVKRSVGNQFGIKLHGAKLQGANLNYAKLKQVDFYGAQFQDASLMSANLEGANLSRANLKRTSLNGAVLVGTYLLDSQLQGASLYNVHFGYHPVPFFHRWVNTLIRRAIVWMQKNMSLNYISRQRPFVKFCNRLKFEGMHIHD